MRIPKSSFAAAVAAAALLAPFAAGAQTSGSSPAPSATAPATAGQAKVSDQQITQAANAMQKVMTLRQAYSQRMAQAAPADRGRVEQEGETAMKQAVTDQGLSVQQYNTILQTAQNDPSVRQKLLSRVPPPTGATTSSPKSGQ
jgi:Domain of unknown function (DUF4168)